MKREKTDKKNQPRFKKREQNQDVPNGPKVNYDGLVLLKMLSLFDLLVEKIILRCF